jgi:hypothetical protein
LFFIEYQNFFNPIYLFRAIFLSQNAGAKVRVCFRKSKAFESNLFEFEQRKKIDSIFGLLFLKYHIYFFKPNFYYFWGLYFKQGIFVR